MAHLIDKDALVAEIESYKSAAEWMLNGKTDLEHWRSQKGTCEKLLSFINTLEVKDVDLEKEIDLDTVIDAYMDKNFGEPWDGARPVGSFELAIMAEHFFELGLKAQKGE